jgi:L-cysteate sulfo-lyase
MQMDRRPLADRLAVFPRLGLANLPTPLEPMKRLTAHLGGPRLWVKREDATGLGFGGNKLRKLDYVLHEAVSSGADTIVSGGVMQSNSPDRPDPQRALAQRRECHLLTHRRRTGAFRLSERARHLNWRSQGYQGWVAVVRRGNGPLVGVDRKRRVSG